MSNKGAPAQCLLRATILYTTLTVPPGTTSLSLSFESNEHAVNLLLPLKYSTIFLWSKFFAI